MYYTRALKIIFILLIYTERKLFSEVECHEKNINDEDYVLPKDAYLFAPGYIEKYGFASETHTAITEDGYILTIHRVLGRKNENSSVEKPAVLVLSGFASTSTYFLVNGPEYSLGLILADQGYDVWLGNQRGSFYSSKHIKYNRNIDSDYWKYNVQEIGYYDVAAMIDYILGKTKKTKMHVVAHSQGSMAFFILASERPEYNEKIILMQAMGPLVYMKHSKNNILSTILSNYQLIKFGVDFLNIGEMFQKNKFSIEFARKYCHEDSPMFMRCFKQLFGDEDISMYNKSMIPIYACHHYAGSSFFPLLHSAQVYNSDKFQKYDYGPVMNMVWYGSVEPPIYRLDMITAPVVLHYAIEDTTSNVTDVLRLKSELGNVVATFEITNPKFNHLAFVLSPSAVEEVYPNLIKIMKEYDEK